MSWCYLKVTPASCLLCSEPDYFYRCILGLQCDPTMLLKLSRLRHLMGVHHPNKFSAQPRRLYLLLPPAGLQPYMNIKFME